MDRQELIENLFIETRAMQRTWKSYFYATLGAEKLSPGQMSLLFYLKNHQSVSGKKIVSDLMMSKSSVAQLIDSLDQLGYIQRESDTTDRRITHVSLTGAGNEKANELEVKWKGFFVKITGKLSDAEITAMIAINKKMAHQIEEYQTICKESKNETTGTIQTS